MAKTKSAKKAARVATRRHVFNVRRQKAMKDIVKEIAGLLNDKKMSEAAGLLPKTYKAIDKASKKGVIKKNTAARMKSRISRRLRSTGA
ncbi:MAG: 30S ribosomal protein S20 [Parcubacteria group bacterium GW2011_GWA2_51_10]|nr:MAG: 30S ribosomal protein S20 [Parcubacteria group bacterium GW2011_GWA2_51_10]